MLYFAERASKNNNFKLIIILDNETKGNLNSITNKYGDNIQYLFSNPKVW